MQYCFAVEVPVHKNNFEYSQKSRHLHYAGKHTYRFLVMIMYDQHLGLRHWSFLLFKSHVIPLQVFITIIFAVITGAIYLRLDNDLQSGIQNRLVILKHLSLTSDFEKANNKNIFSVRYSIRISWYRFTLSIVWYFVDVGQKQWFLPESAESLSELHVLEKSRTKSLPESPGIKFSPVL